MDAGHATCIKHAVNVLGKLEREGRADARWNDEAAFLAVELYRKLNPLDAADEAA